MKFDTYRVKFYVFKNMDNKISINTLRAARIIQQYGNTLEVKLADDPKTTYRELSGYELVQKNGELYVEYSSFGYSYKVLAIGNTPENLVKLDDPTLVDSKGKYLPVVGKIVYDFREHSVLLHTNDKYAVISNTEFNILKIIDLTNKDSIYVKRMNAILRELEKLPKEEELI